jgi:hypothetical protein
MSYKNKQESVLVGFGDMFCPYTFGDFNGDGRFDPGVSLEEWASYGFSDAKFDPDTLQTTASDADYARCREANFDLSSFSINMVELVPLNITDATTAGAEMEWFWQLSSNDRFQGFVTLVLHNEIGNIDVSQLPLTVGDSLACLDREGGCPSVDSLDGNELPFAPVFAMSANYAHDFDLGGHGWLTAQAFVNVSSSYYLSIWNVDCYTSTATGEQVCDNGDKQEAYATVDVNLRYNSELSDWFLEAYGTNLTGTTYATFNHRSGADGVTGYAFNAPRQFGVRGGFTW